MKAAVLGVGSILFKDDGLGVAAARKLEETQWPGDISIYDAGTALINLLPVFAENNLVIVIDALKGDNIPGTIYRLLPGELTEWSKKTASFHDAEVMDVINLAALFNSQAEVIIFGMEPADLTLGIGLSAPIQERLPVLVEYVRQELTAYIEKYPKDC